MKRKCASHAARWVNTHRKHRCSDREKEILNQRLPTTGSHFVLFCFVFVWPLFTRAFTHRLLSCALVLSISFSHSRFWFSLSNFAFFHSLSSRHCVHRWVEVEVRDSFARRKLNEHHTNSRNTHTHYIARMSQNISEYHTQSKEVFFSLFDPSVCKSTDANRTCSVRFYDIIPLNYDCIHSL